MNDVGNLSVASNVKNCFVRNMFQMLETDVRTVEPSPLFTQGSMVLTVKFKHKFVVNEKNKKPQKFTNA